MRIRLPEGLDRPRSTAQPLPSSPIQAKFIAKGETSDFATLINTILGVRYQIQVSNLGEVSVQDSGSQGPLTLEAKELLGIINKVILDGKTTTIEFVRGDPEVIVGSYALSKVDLDDVEFYGHGLGMGDTAAIQLVHEIEEQYRKQVHGEDFDTAHATAYSAQERALGAKLISESPMKQISKSMGEVTTTYKYPNNRIVNVIHSIDFDKNKIVGVKRTVR